MPAVSILIATYNRAAYLREALDSVLGQSYHDFEVVVIDDGSTDGSTELLRDYQRRYPDKIRHFWHEGRINKGTSSSLNAAIEQSGGRYLAWLDSDDVWFPDKLAKQMSHIESQPALGMVYGYAVVIDENGTRFPGLIGGDVSRDAFRQLVIGNAICPSTVLMRRACLDDVGWFNEGVIYHDWELFIRIAARYPIGFISEPLAFYRIHARNISILDQAETKLERSLAVIDTVFSERTDVDPGLRDKALAAVYFAAVLDYCAAGQLGDAGHYLENTRSLLNGSLPLEPEELIGRVVAYATYSFRGTQEEKVRFVRAVFSIVAPSLEGKAVAHFHITDAFASHLRGNSPGARQHILQALGHDPGWLRNRGVLSIGAEAFLGPVATKKLRRLARTFKQRGT